MQTKKQKYQTSTLTHAHKLSLTHKHNCFLFIMNVDSSSHA